MVDEDRDYLKKPEEKKTLLEKYEIPVDHLSYEYITQCDNAKELERIIIILRSGEEGYYPDLTTHAEKHLTRLKPLSTVLRVAEPVLKRDMLEPENRVMLENDINEWMSEMKIREKDLAEGRAMDTSEPIPQPAIRKITFDQPEKNEKSSQKQKKHKRIAACDYKAWDTYDAETELNRIDLQRDMKQAEAKRAQKMLRNKEEKMLKESRSNILNKLTLTGTELSVMAEKDREKGNEAFKAGDYEEALHFYTSSIEIDATINAYNNRAITHIKLERYDDAVNDCNKVISMDYTNIKALVRRGRALEHLERKSQALADYEAVLKLEPSNRVAVAAVNKLRGPCSSKKIRMKIEDEAAADERSNGEAADPENNKVDNTLAAANNESDKREKTVSLSEASSLSINSPKKSTNLATGGSRRGKQFSIPNSRIRSQVCFCNNAPSSSQCSTPQPHFRDVYCPKASQNCGTLKKTQSIFTDTKISPGKASSVVIEEVPNEPCERSENKENQREGKVNVDEDKTRLRKRQNNSFPNFGGGDHNESTKKSDFGVQELSQKKYKSEGTRKIGKGLEKSSGGMVNRSKNLSSPQGRSGNTSGVIIEEISNEECVKIREHSKIKSDQKILDESDTIPKNCEAFENGDRNEMIGPADKELFPKGYEKNALRGNDNCSEFSPSLTIEPNSFCTDCATSSERSSSSNIEDVHSTLTEKFEEKFSPKENIEQQKKPLKVEKTPTFATADHEEIDSKECQLCDKTIGEKNESETVAGMREIKFEKIESPYEFLRQWYAIRNDNQLIRHASLLKAMPPESIEEVMGNKLDGDMLSLILTCLEQHFCCPENSKVLNRFLQHLGKVNRFSIIRMFMDKKDEKALRNIFSFLDGQGMADQTQDLRKMYNVPV